MASARMAAWIGRRDEQVGGAIGLGSACEVATEEQEQHDGTCGPFEGGGVFWRHCRFLAREQVFNGDYLKAGELPERRIERGPITKIMPSDGCKGDYSSFGGGTVVPFPQIVDGIWGMSV